MMTYGLVIIIMVSVRNVVVLKLLCIMIKSIYIEPVCYVRCYHSVQAWLCHIGIMALKLANLLPVYSYGILTGHWIHQSQYIRYRCLVDTLSFEDLKFYFDNNCTPCDVHSKGSSCKGCSMSVDEVYLRDDDFEFTDLPF